MRYRLEPQRLISHATKTINLNDTINSIAERIKKQGDKPYATVKYQLELLAELSNFDFGKFLLQNQGINGFWTHYMLTFPWFGRKTDKNNQGQSLTKLENFLLNRAPTILATQQRFEIFLKENQKKVTNDTTLACIPCGMMGELLYLDFNGINTIHLDGIDYDLSTLHDAEMLAKDKNLIKFSHFIQSDAWNLNANEKYDLISSNGLNIYEPDDEAVTALYKGFYKALKPGGKLVTSFLTFPPTLTDKCEWLMSEINQEDLFLQKIIFSDIIAAKWQCFRSSEQTIKQLTSVGYVNIKILYDKAKLFPTVVAYKGE